MITVLSDFDTVDKIVAERLSVSRFGDGEYKIVEGGGTKTQKGHPALTARLREILKNDFDRRVLVCILDLYSNKPVAGEWASREAVTARFGSPLFARQFLRSDKVYGCASITRLCNWALGDVHEYWSKVRQIWDDRPVLLVVGSKKGRSAERRLLDNALSIEVLDLHQKSDCWEHYPTILTHCQEWARKRAMDEPLVLAALGATATVLAYDLGVGGVQSIDMGHMAQAYHHTVLP